MAKNKPYDYNQKIMMPLTYEKQIQHDPCENTISYFIYNKTDINID
jgi:hypothetical protein